MMLFLYTLGSFLSTWFGVSWFAMIVAGNLHAINVTYPAFGLIAVMGATFWPLLILFIIGLFFSFNRMVLGDYF